MSYHRKAGRAGKLSFDKARTISIQQHKKLTKYRRAKRGDVLVSKSGSLGVCAIVDTDQEFSIYESIIVLQANSSLDSKFLLSLIRDEQTQVRMIGEKVGSTVGHLNLEMFRKLVIPLPPLPEQRAIAATLSDVDALIAALDNLIAKQRHLKTATMQQLLTGKKRLPGFSGEWIVQQLGEISEIVMGQSPSSLNYNLKGEGLPLIQGNADIVERQTIKRVFTLQITKLGKSGDILMTVRAPVGQISQAKFDICLGRGVCALRFPNTFLYHFLISIESTWAKHSKGSTFDSVNSSDISAIKVNLPSDAQEQRAIATVLSDMDAAISALETRRAKTQAIKQGMMQELLTGKTRLINNE